MLRTIKRQLSRGVLIALTAAIMIGFMGTYRYRLQRSNRSTTDHASNTATWREQKMQQVNQLKIEKMPPIKTAEKKKMPESSSPPESCQKVRVSDKILPLVALASSPGSGNTWARHLLQQASGIYSSSIYTDPMMSAKEFPKKRRLDGTASPIKTHRTAENTKVPRVQFDKAILLLRDPYAALRANYNRYKAGKTGVIAEKDFHLFEWLRFVTRLSKKWVLQAVSWLGNEKPVFLMQFDSLKDDLTHVLKEAVTFLELNTTSELLECTASNTEGSYHREKTHSMEQLLVFPHNYTVVIEHYKDVVQWYLRRRCPEPPLCIPYSEVNLTGRPDI